MTLAGGARPLVLAVDDEAPILSSIQRLLAFVDLEVVTAPDGMAALELLRRREVAVVLTDQHMPGIQGVELLRLARDLSPETSRILFSGHIDIELLRSAVNGGEVYRFVTKPWDDDELLSAVRQGAERWLLLRQNRVLHEESQRRARELEQLVASRDLALAAHERLAGLGRSLLDGLPLVVLAVDGEGRLVLINRLAQAAFPALTEGDPAAALPPALAAWCAHPTAAGLAVATPLGEIRCEPLALGQGGLGIIGIPMPPVLDEP